MNVAVTVFLIFGTVFGAGFSSGNEIVVFFSRFGKMSYAYIFLASVLMALVIYFFLRKGKKIARVIEQSKFLNIVTVFITTIFCASMYAGVDGLLFYLPKTVHFVFTFFVLLLCLIVTIKGMSGLEKINFYIMPFLSILFLILLVFESQSVGQNMEISNNFLGLFYSPLYVALNTCMSVFVLAKRGEKMSKKQTLLSCLFSSFLLFGFLLLSNFVLLKNPESFSSEMPFLYVCGDNFSLFLIEFFVILIGCFTTLISLCFTLKYSMINILKNNYLCVFSSVFLPYFISCIGFSQIISFLYPICSVLSFFVILFSVFSFKQTDKIIHQKCKNTQDGG